MELRRGSSMSGSGDCVGDLDAMIEAASSGETMLDHAMYGIMSNLPALK